MIQTTNYKLNKIELVDSPADITVLNVNWDKIDTELNNLSNNKFDKSGGTISGAVTVNGTLTTNSLVNIGEYKLKVDITKGQTPIEAKYATIGIYDNSLSEGYRLGRIQYGISTNNTASMAMYVNRPNDAESEDSCGLLAQWLNGTMARISVTHHPETASNDKSVATTYWVRNLKATTSQYGLVKLADETAILNESDESALTVDKAYELNDFRRKETAYAVGDKVNCAFNFGLFLECTTAGTTSAGTLDTRNVTHAQVITDGTCQWTVRTHVKSVNGNVPDANGNIEVPTTDTEQIKQIVLNTFFPIGSIYMDATGNIDPNTQFGGTWAKIENRFLLASGTKSIGATGGSETVTLTTDQIPSHSHGAGTINFKGQMLHNKTEDQSTVDQEFTNDSGAVTTQIVRSTNIHQKNTAYVANGWGGFVFEGSKGRSGETAKTGSGEAHDNMPPYEVVNVWKRTA